MLATDMLGISMALISAVVWGSADFSGGLATRSRNNYVVLFLSAVSGLVVLAVAACIKKEGFPSLEGILWAALAGCSGTFGITALYKGLSIGHSALVAPTSAVIGAGLPVAFGLLTQGLPDPFHLVGFTLAIVGIWIVSQTSAARDGNSRKGLILACIAGLGFAGFLIFVARVEPGKVFTPLLVSRVMVVLGTLLMLRLNKIGFPRLKGNWFCLLTGVLDVGGNIFFMLAKQFTRLDTAVILSGLYPAATVILTGVLLKEKINLKQWGGVVICMAAIILITR